MVVVPEPAVKGGGAFAARAVDRAVGPAVEERADKALCLAVCLRPVGTGASVADAQPPAGECVHKAAVTGAVVAEDGLDDDPVASVEDDRALEETRGGACLLVFEDLGVGETAVVVDGDVDVLPTRTALQPPLIAAALAC